MKARPTVTPGQVWRADNDRTRVVNREIRIDAIDGDYAAVTSFNPQTEAITRRRIRLEHFAVHRSPKGHVLRPKYWLVREAPAAEQGAA